MPIRPTLHADVFGMVPILSQQDMTCPTCGTVATSAHVYGRGDSVLYTHLTHVDTELDQTGDHEWTMCHPIIRTTR